MNSHEKVATRMEKEITDIDLNKVIELAKEIVNEICPTTEPFFMAVVTAFLIDVTTKAIADTTDSLASASDGYDITRKLFEQKLHGRLAKKFCDTPEMLIAELKKLGAWK